MLGGMSGFEEYRDFFPEARNPQNVRAINNRCMIRTQEGHTVVIVSGIVLTQYPSDDSMAEAHAMVNLVEQGLADQVEVARAFGCSTRTVRRHQQRFAEGGLGALGRKRGYPSGRARLAASRRKRIEKLKAQGCSSREIASIFGVTARAVRKVLRRLGLYSEPSPQAELPLNACSGGDPKLSAFSIAQPGHCSPSDSQQADVAESAKSSRSDVSSGGDPKWSAFVTGDTDPKDRRGDRLLASLGLLDDAPPLFGCGRAIPRAGVLLAIPALVRSGVFRCAQKVYGGIGPAFYGLRTSLLTLLLMALWRIKRPEGLKEYSPQDLGRVLGLDRAPEVKTLRRKLTRLSQAGKAAQLGRALAEERVAARGDALGFLYVDGHVRVYHGKHPLPKTHVARMRLSMPATSDYWVNDAQGDPLLVITAEANAGLVKMLPGLLEQVRSLTGSRRTTVVFDRGGFSPKLFQQIIAAGFDLLTYRKGPIRRILRKLFQEERACVDGREVSYMLADQEVRLLKGKLRLRQVTRLSEDGHQTPILTSRRDLAAALVAYRMFERWRQENFFKYLREEYALDALVEYAAVPDDCDREVPNPAWKNLDRKLQQAIAELDCLQKEYGIEASQSLGARRQTVRKFQAAQASLLDKISAAQRRVDRWRRQRNSILKRVPVQTAIQQSAVKLAPERKHLTNLIKMLAYQTESELLRAIAPHYRRAGDEGRTLVQSALASAADIEITSNELRVTLAPLSSQHRTRAVAALCDHLNLSRTRFPGTELRLVFSILDHD
jgi:transposase